MSSTDHQGNPAHMTQAQNLQQATSKVNRFAKRDPALYPLSIVVCGMLGVAGYFLCVVSPAAGTVLIRQHDQGFQPRSR